MKINATAKLFLVALLFGLFITAGTYFITQTTSKSSGSVIVTGDVISSTNHGYPFSYFNDYTYMNEFMCVSCNLESNAYKVYWLHAFVDIIAWSSLSCVVFWLGHKARTK